MIRHLRASMFLFIFASTAMAQTPVRNWSGVKALAAGTSVRVSVGGHTTTGYVQSVTDDSLVVDSEKGEEGFPRQQVSRVSVKKRGHRGRNTLIGLVVGAGGGAIAGAAAHQNCTGFCILYTSRAQDAAIGAIVVGAVGAGVGALIPTGGWHEVYKQ